MIYYIDPPYDTGNGFIYPDNYTKSLQEEKGTEGIRLEGMK